MEPLLKVSDLQKSYTQKQVLKGISFEVFPGEIVAFLGANGAGKTTTFNIIQGYLNADAGEVNLFGHDVSGELPDEVKKRIGITLQYNYFLKHAKVREIVDLEAALFDVEPLEEDLKDFHINPISKLSVNNLSGGQRQRLSIFLSFFHKPDLIFLDEPSAALDVKARNDLWKYILKTKDEKRAIIFNTHYLEEAERYADRVIILKEGTIFYDGSFENLSKKYDNKSLEEIFLGIEDE